MDGCLQQTMDARGVVSLTLNRPERRNAFDDGLIAALTAAFARIEVEAGVRAIILRGAGKTFCAGADLAWMRRVADYSIAENLADARALAAMLHALDTLAVPSLCVVQGAAFGGGVGLAACCDVVIAAEDARFCLSETRLGLTPATISPYVVAAMGARQARRYCVTAEVFDARRALAIGLVHECVPADALDACGEGVLNALLACQPRAQAEAKRLVAEAANRVVDAGLIEQTSQRIAHRRVDPEARAAIGAFLAQR